MRRGTAGTHWLVWTIAVAGVIALTGCDGFFVPVNPTPPPGSSGDFAYVANTTAGSLNSVTGSLSGYSLSSGTLKTVPGLPMALGYTPVAMAVSRNNQFLYVAAPGDINVYTINSDGSLSTPSGGTGVAIANVVSMDVSPDGQWLVALDNPIPGAAQIDVFQINASTGALSSLSPTSVTNGDAVVVPKMVKISPNGSLVFAALGSGGDIVFNFDTTNGSLFNSQTLSVSAQTSDNGLAIDSTTSHLYIARSGSGGGVRVFTIGSGGALNEISGSPFASGGQATTVVLDNTGKYAYAANRTNGTIYGYSIGSNGALTALGGSPYTSGQLVSSLGMDNSGKYLLAVASGGSPDLGMFSFDATTPGKLDLVTSTATDTDPAGAIAVAMTH